MKRIQKRRQSAAEKLALHFDMEASDVRGRRVRGLRFTAPVYEIPSGELNESYFWTAGEKPPKLKGAVADGALFWRLMPSSKDPNVKLWASHKDFYV